MSFHVDDSKAIAFGATMFASACLNNLFVTYYMEMFMSVPITPTWFYCGQLVFMVWNALNDPIIGWIFDRLDTDDRRLPAIRYGGPLWALAFLLTWYSPGGESPLLAGLHFVFTLCFYDGMLTLVEVRKDQRAREIERARERER